MTTLSYQTVTAPLHSRWSKVGLVAAVLACVLFQLDMVYARLVVEPAYRATGLVGAPLSGYEHYSNLKAVAVTIFLVTLGLLGVALVCALVGLLQRGKRRVFAVIALLAVILQLAVIAATL